MLAQVDNDFQGEAPLSAAEAAITVLDGVRAGAWRILVGEDAKMTDAAARQPEAADDYAGLFNAAAEQPTAQTPLTLAERTGGIMGALGSGGRTRRSRSPGE
jgi:hypothetical protein